MIGWTAVKINFNPRKLVGGVRESEGEGRQGKFVT